MIITSNPTGTVLGGVSSQDCRTNVAQQNQAAHQIQAFLKGVVARKQISVHRVAPGVLHIHLHGDENLFGRISIPIYPKKRKRTVDIFSIDSNQYKGSAIGGAQFFHPVSASDEERQAFLGKGQQNVFINGGFFNDGNGYSDFAAPVPIGPTCTSHTQDFIPIPENYQDQFSSVAFEDGSYISVAPVLTQSGISRFPSELENLKRFNYKTVRKKEVEPKPGDLFHASEPNPRAGIVTPRQHKVPAASPTEPIISLANRDRIRLVVARTTTKRGPRNNGFTMSEWANVLTRLSKMNSQPGETFNLDGGRSVAMGITDHQGKIIRLISQVPEGHGVSTLLTFQHTEKAKNSHSSH